MPKRTSVALRHTPKQVRGERRVEQLLRSAEVVFAEVGYEHATTNAVAAHAGVSIGSLYQFFASKDSLLEAMAQRYLDETRAELVSTLDDERYKDLDQLVRVLMERMVKLQDQRPYFLQCLSQNRAYAALAGSVSELQSVVTAHLVSLLGRLCVPAPEGIVLRRAQICVFTASALLPLAVEAKGKQRALILDEVVAILAGYIRPHLREVQL